MTKHEIALIAAASALAGFAQSAVDMDTEDFSSDWRDRLQDYINNYQAALDAYGEAQRANVVTVKNAGIITCQTPPIPEVNSGKDGQKSGILHQPHNI